MADGAARDTEQLMEKVPLIVATVAAVALVLSVIRQYGFFSQTDGRLMAFLSIEDLIRNTLYYIPASLLSLLSGSAGRFFRATFPSNAADQSEVPPWWVRFFVPLRKGDVVWNAALIILSIVFFSNWPTMVLVFILVSFPGIIATVALNPRLRNVRYIGEITMVLITCVFFWLWGISEGRAAIAAPPDYVVSLSDGTKQPVALLKVGAQFTLVAGADGHLQQLANPTILKLTQIALPVHRPPIPWLEDVTLGQIAEGFERFWNGPF